MKIKKVTILTLAGGSGLGDGFFYLFDDLMDKYSIISFNYPMDFRDNDSLSDAIAELIKKIGATNVYLLGQSYGGLLAQIIAKKHPECIKGLILSGTSGMGKDMPIEGVEHAKKMFDPKKIEKNIKTDKRLPMRLLVPLFKLMTVKLIKDKKMRKDFKDIIDICRGSMTDEYFVLMDTLLGDLRNHMCTISKEDFMPYKNEVMLVFSKDDTIFLECMKQNLIDTCTSPFVIEDLKGGHLALMQSKDGYLAKLNEFLENRN